MTGTRSAWLLLGVGIGGLSTATLWIRLSDSSAAELAFRRLALTLPILFLWLRRPARPERLPSQRPAPRWILVAGVSLAVHFWMWIRSLDSLPVSTSLILVSLHPIMVLAFEAAARRVRLSGGALIGVVSGVGGTMVLAGEEAGAGDAVGVWLAVGAAAAMASYLLATRELRREGPAVGTVGWTYLVATLALAIPVVVEGGSLLPPTGREWGLAALLALFPTLLGHTPMNAALRRLPATVVSTAFLGEVVGGTLLVWTVLGEPPSALFPWGAPLIALGIVLAGRAASPTR